MTTTWQARKSKKRTRIIIELTRLSTTIFDSVIHSTYGASMMAVLVWRGHFESDRVAVVVSRMHVPAVTIPGNYSSGRNPEGWWGGRRVWCPIKELVQVHDKSSKFNFGVPFSSHHVQDRFVCSVYLPTVPMLSYRVIMR